jgi:hypothetical protein
MWTSHKIKEQPAMTDLERVRNVTVYLASRNSTGIHEEVLRVRGDDYILGTADGSHYVPWGHLSRLGKGGDWRTRHCFATYDEAKADYITLENKRVAVARAALKSIAA